MKKHLILLLCVLAGFVYCKDNKQKYYFEEVDGYVQISKETSDFLAKKLNFHISIKSGEKFDYVFQKLTVDSLLAAPYIMVQINESGKMTESALKEFEKYNYKYDAKTHYLWKENGTQLNVMIPTNLGSLNVYCFSSPVILLKTKNRL
jgi:hypothetical protein